MALPSIREISSNSSLIWEGCLRPTIELRHGGESQNLLDPLRDGPRDHAVGINEKSDRREKDSELLRELPLPLNDNREPKPMLLGLTAILVELAAADQNQGQPITAYAFMEAYEMRCKLLTGTAMRIAEQEQYLPAAIRLKRDCIALQVRKRECRSNAAWVETVAFDPTLGERSFAG